MKLRVALVLLSCIVSAITGFVIARNGPPSVASSAVAARSKPLIGLSFDTLASKHRQQDRDTFVARARELGAGILIQDANSDDARQLSDIRSMIASKVNVLVIVPRQDGNAMGKGVELAHEAGIAVISYDRLITGSDPDLYVSFHAGPGLLARKAAELAVNLAEGKPIVAAQAVNNGKIDVPSVLYGG